MEGKRNMAARGRGELSFQQIQRLQAVMDEEIEIHGRGNFPTLQMSLKEFVEEVIAKVKEEGIETIQAKINGGAASHIVALYEQLPFNDIDLIFVVDLSTPEKFEAIKAAVLRALLEFLPASANKQKITQPALISAYVRKLVKVDDDDRWSLLSLNNEYGRFIDLKFVDKMRRQFEFSVDAFQINLDSFLAFYGNSGNLPASSQQETSTLGLLPPTEDLEDADSAYSTISSDICDDATTENARHRHDTNASSCSSNALPKLPLMKMPPTVYPTVVAENVYGDYKQALQHLNDKLIDTWHPESIRGGGLLKYCNLLVKGYRPAVPHRLCQMEKYMCSRFFIDFPDVDQQQKKLLAYMETHFRGDLPVKHEYAMLLYRIVNESTTCLMNHERRLTLSMIEEVAHSVMLELSYYNYARFAAAAYPISRPQAAPTILYVPSPRYVQHQQQQQAQQQHAIQQSAGQLLLHQSDDLPDEEEYCPPITAEITIEEQEEEENAIGQMDNADSLSASVNQLSLVCPDE